MRFKNMEDFRLVMSDDRDFISAPVIGSPKGWGYDPKNPGLGMMAEALFKQPDLRAGWPEPPPATREEEKKRRELWIEAVNLFRQQKAQSEQHIRENREAFERDKARRLERNREALPDWYKEREPIDEPKTGALKPVRTPALKAWFGNSKVVDANGEPLVVYHGSKSPWVSSFDLGMAGKAWAGASTHPLEGIWFTSEKKAAKYFADYGPKRRANEEEFVEYGEDGEYYSAVMPKKGNPETSQPLFSVGPYDDPQKAEREARNQALLYNRRIRSDTHTMAVYLKIENPLVMDGNGGPPRTPEFYQAHQEGRDGIICTDVFDGAYKSTVYVVFSPSQIKSADRNTGTFDPNDLTITASTSKQAFIRDDLVWLKHYLTMTDAQKGEELARNWTRDLLVFLKRTDPKLFRKLGLATPSVWKEYMEDYDDKLDAATAFFQDKDMFDKVPPAIYEGFLEPQGNYIMQNDPAEAPSFLHMSYEGIVRNKWLLHYTDNPDEIVREGFTIGMGDLDRLGLTTYYTNKAKGGGYNFAVPADQAHSIRDFEFGKHAVLFRASGVMTYHWADSFNQVIFWGRDARDIIPIYHNDETGRWELPSDQRGKPVFQAEDIQEVVDWAIAHFEQYRWMSQYVGSKVRSPKPTQDYLDKAQKQKEDRLKAGFTAAAGLHKQESYEGSQWLGGLGEAIAPRNPLLISADSHKETPHRENEFPDLDQGESLQGYADMPECIEDNRAGLSLDELINQAEKTAAAVGWLYHVTYFNRLEDIIWLGLEPNHPASIGGQHGWHTKDRSFLTEWRGVTFWYARAVQWAYYNSDHPVEDGLTPVVLRTKEYKRLDTQEDEIGTTDAGAQAAFTEKTIPARRLEVWNGHQWVRLTEDAVAAMRPEGYDPPSEDEWVDEDSKEYKERYIDENTLYPKTAAAVLDRMPPWGEFVRQNGGIEKLVDSFGDNWDRWEPWDPEDAKAFDALPEEEQQAVRNDNAYREIGQRYDDILDQHMSWDFPLIVYRVLTLPDIKNLKTKGLGVYWSWDEDAAEAHWGYGQGSGSVEYTLKAQVQEGDIDWKGTIWANLDPSIGEDEKEIRLRKGARPLLLAWKRGDEAWQVPLRQWRSITASKEVE